MSTEQMGTYEKIYFALWELGQRYGNFVQFRVIGRSHDDRMIPMLEIGKGDTCIICLSGKRRQKSPGISFVHCKRLLQIL